MLSYFAEPVVADACQKIDRIIDCRQKRQLGKRWSKADPFHVGAAGTTKLPAPALPPAPHQQPRPKAATARPPSALGRSIASVPPLEPSTDVDDDNCAGTLLLLCTRPASPPHCVSDSSSDETTVDGGWSSDDAWLDPLPSPHKHVADGGGDLGAKKKRQRLVGGDFGGLHVHPLPAAARVE